jgi:hypothetical protein
MLFYLIGIATAFQTEKLNTFIKNYERQLETIQEALEESLSGIWYLFDLFGLLFIVFTFFSFCSFFFAFSVFCFYIHFLHLCFNFYFSFLLFCFCVLDVWDATVDPIAFDLAPYEQTHILKLINTDNKIYNKVTLVFAALCQEMQSLKEAVCFDMSLFGRLCCFDIRICFDVLFVRVWTLI